MNDRTSTIYEFAGGSVAYFAPDAPAFQEAGELKGDALAAVPRILNGSGVRCTASTYFAGCVGERSAREWRKYLSHKVNGAV